MQKRLISICLLISFAVIVACKQEASSDSKPAYPGIERAFGTNLNVANLPDYEGQSVPNYISKDNTDGNEISNEVASLGRVLFYDRKLSVNNQISCSSCHIQAYAFGDTAQLSTGINGKTSRHSMRLINARFSTERSFFWDERAPSLEEQTTQPIQDHIEMGYTGEDGDSSLNDLLLKLMAIDYYQELARLAFGDELLTEARLQIALAQFVRSIQSFDSKYDAGRQQVNSDLEDFPNFSTEENQGKFLYMTATGSGGAFCSGCHIPPEFDINQFSRNNGAIGVAGDPDAVDLFNTRSPSLRDLVNPQGELNGPLMHNGNFKTLLSVVNHYNSIPSENQNPYLDGHLRRGPQGTQQLNLSEANKQALIAFLKTLSGNEVYVNPDYSNPFINP
ncbi:MAG: cytochrome-c peroxidase [Bacteroidetes bacterium]|nr:cytochrome-c peroxidase [Bacteroidota bacterium]